MPYYLDRKALSSIDDRIIRSRVERLFDLSVKGFSTGLPPRIRFQMREEEVENYKGYYVARSISFANWGKEYPTYTLAILDGEVDARVSFPSAEKSPWLGDTTPSLEEIERFWRPVCSSEQIEEVVRLFCIVETHALKYHLPASEETKLSRVEREEVDLQALDGFCKILGNNDQATAEYIEDHVIFAAYNPKNYLKHYDFISNMTADQCKSFSWRRTVYGGKSYFLEKGHLQIMDWKASAEDVTWCINALARQRGVKTIANLSIKEEAGQFRTEHYLQEAANAIEKSGFSIVLIDDGSDSYIFTMLRNRNVRAFIGAGEAIGLSVWALRSQRKKWWQREATGKAR